MSTRSGKFVIGLTGNVGTGKSVVRRMLEDLGAFGLDADHLAHEAMNINTPGYHQVVAAFGSQILDPDGQINRAVLAGIVFSDRGRLKTLETILHPIVEASTASRIESSPRRVVVIEAIKLLESNLANLCGSIWVVDALPSTRYQRLVEGRGMPAEDAHRRMSAQDPQEIKLSAAHVIIHNDSTLEDTRRQVEDAWLKNIPEEFRLSQ